MSVTQLYPQRHVMVPSTAAHTVGGRPAVTLPPVRRLSLDRVPGFYTSPTHPVYVHSWFDRVEMMHVRLTQIRRRLQRTHEAYFASSRPLACLLEAPCQQAADCDSLPTEWPANYWATFSPPWMQAIADQITQTIHTYVNDPSHNFARLKPVLISQWAELSTVRGALLYINDRQESFPPLYMSPTDLTIYGPPLRPDTLSLHERIDFLKTLSIAHSILYTGMMPRIRILKSSGEERLHYDPWHDLGRSLTISTFTPLLGAIEYSFTVQPEDRVEITYRLPPSGRFALEQLQDPVAVRIPQQHQEQQKILRHLFQSFIGAYLCAYFNITDLDLERLVVNGMLLNCQDDSDELTIRIDPRRIASCLTHRYGIPADDVALATPYISYALSSSWIRVDDVSSDT